MNVLYDFDDGKYMANFLFNDTLCKVVMVKGDPGEPTDAQVKTAVYEYLEEHPNTFNPEGEYEDFTAGNANQLTSNIYTEDTTPYIYRALPEGAGNREVIEQITGGTVAWNQLFGLTTYSGTFSGVTVTPDGAGSYSVSGTATGQVNYFLPIQYVYPAGHKVLITGTPTGGSTTTFFLSLRVNNASTILGKETGNGLIVNNNTDKTDATCILRVVTGTAISGTLKFTPQVFDLTQMFGSTIADYIYSLEQSTAGAGVSLFRSLFPESYYSYNAGELESVKTSARETVGKNLLNVTDVTVASRTFNVDSDGWITAENKTSDPRQFTYANSQWYATLPKGTYYLDYWCANVSTSESRSIALYLNDGSKVVNAFRFGKSGSVSFTLSDTNIVGVFAKIYESTIRIQIRSADAPTGYEPYQKHTYPLSNIELRGITKLVNNKLTYDGDIYKADGSVTRRYGIRAYQSGDATGDTMITDGTNTVYQLSAETTETTTPYTETQICSPYGTEEFIDDRDVQIPVGHKTKYPTDQVKKLDGLPSDFSTLIAPTESGTASRNYSVGSFLIMNNQLYKVTSAIASGAAITVGTNVTATTLAEQIIALLNQ